MTHSRHWQVRSDVAGDGDDTSARAVLDTGAGTVRAAGGAHRAPGDPRSTAVGDEVAAGRALLALGRRMIDAATVDLHTARRRAERGAARGGG